MRVVTTGSAAELAAAAADWTAAHLKIKPQSDPRQATVLPDRLARSMIDWFTRVISAMYTSNSCGLFRERANSSTRAA